MRFLPLLVSVALFVAVNSFAMAQSAKSPRPDVNGEPLPKGAIARLGTVRFQLPESRFGSYIITSPRAVALSPDGKTVATAINGNKNGIRIDLMETANGKLLRKFTLTDKSLGLSGGEMQFTPDGKHLVFGDWSGITRLDGATDKVAKSINVRVSAFALSADGKWLAAQPQKHVFHSPVVIWEAMSSKRVALLPGRGSSCKGLAFGPNGKRLLLWSIVPTNADKKSIGFRNDSKVAVACIDIDKRQIIAKTTVGYYQNVALCPDGETVALEDSNRQGVRILHLPTGRERYVIPVKEAKLAFAPDGKVLFTIAKDGRASLWDTAMGNKIRDLEGKLVGARSRIVGISKDGKTIAALDDGWDSAATVVVWNAETGKRAVRPPGHQGAVTCLAYAPGGKLLASGSADKTVRLWNTATGAHIRKLAVHKKAITAIAFSPDGKLLSSASKDGVIRMSNIADGKVVAEFAGPKEGANQLAFAPKAGMLFAGGSSPEVFAWMLDGAKEAAHFQTGKNGSVLAFTQDGALALTSTWVYRFFLSEPLPPERLHVWNPINKKAIAHMPIRPDELRHYGTVRCESAVFSPDSRIIASSQITEMQGIRPSYGYARLRLWERTTGQEIQTLGPTITKVLAFSPTGRLLASGRPGRSGHLSVGYGSGIDIWDVVTGKKAGGLGVSPKCLAFSPDGSHLATGGRDHSVLIWKAPRVQTTKKAKAPSAAQRNAWWSALGSHAKEAYKAMAQMIEAPEHAVALLKERVKPVRPSDPRTVAKLIAQLDSGKFSERQKAQAELEKLDEGAVHLIKKALEGKVTLELHLRLNALLRKYDAANGTSVLGMQQYRAVETLEWIGTPDARRLLRTWAGGAGGSRLAMEAQAALKRLPD